MIPFNIVEDNGIQCIIIIKRIKNSDDKNLLYQYILNWDIDTNYLCSRYSKGRINEYYIDIQTNGFEYITLKDEQNQIIAFEKSNLLFVFNFNCHTSFSDYHVPVRNEGNYRCILSVYT